MVEIILKKYVKAYKFERVRILEAKMKEMLFFQSRLQINFKTDIVPFINI